MRKKLDQPWIVLPIPLDADPEPYVTPYVSIEIDAAEWQIVPPARHLQPVLYPQNPYWGDHIRTLNDRAWLYRQTFDYEADPNAPYTRIVFEGVDYAAEVWLNGEYLGFHEGAFDPFAFDVELQETNTLALVVRSPWDKVDPTGTSPVDRVRRGMIKGLYEHSEGLIPPDVNPIGIWRHVYVESDQGIRFAHTRIRTHADGTVNLRVTFENATPQPVDLEMQIAIKGETHDGPGTTGRSALRLQPGRSALEIDTGVPEPRLWWPVDVGEQDLYRLELTLLDPEGEARAHHQESFGIREVTLDRKPDAFVFRVNGRPVFLRGASYLPEVYLSELGADRIARDLDLAREANLNALRVHVHVAPHALYEMADRRGLLIWQDFELNWLQDFSVGFERRALKLQTRMIDMLYNHPSVIAWCCHNEPTMVYFKRENYLQQPDPALYEAARAQDPTRPVFIASGQNEEDWQRAGDIHTYYGAIWGGHFTDVYKHPARLNTEFGLEAPAALETLKANDILWPRMAHLEDQIASIWQYQAELVRFHAEFYRSRRWNPSAGYFAFMLVDPVPQVGCGLLDSERRPKGGYAALAAASEPLLLMLAHDGQRFDAVHVINDTPNAYENLRVTWTVSGSHGDTLLEGEESFNLPANGQHAIPLEWAPIRKPHAHVALRLFAESGEILAESEYDDPFHLPQRPKGYPWNFDPELGMKVFDKEDAESIVPFVNDSPFLKSVAPLAIYPFVELSLKQVIPARRVAPIIERLQSAWADLTAPKDDED